jgi:putative membrane protein
MMYGNDMAWGWGWMALMPLLWIGVLAVVVWLIVRLTRSTDAGAHRVDQAPQPRETAQEILDLRFASGEIDATVYSETRARLAGREPGS